MRTPPAEISSSACGGAPRSACERIFVKRITGNLPMMGQGVQYFVALSALIERLQAGLPQRSGQTTSRRAEADKSIAGGKWSLLIGVLNDKVFWALPIVHRKSPVNVNFLFCSRFNFYWYSWFTYCATPDS